MKEKKLKGLSFDESILGAMHCLDKQVARDLNTRTPQEKMEHGEQKWSAHEQRVESTVVLILDALGDKQVELDSLIILSQAFVKAMSIVSSDLGEEGLGSIRAGYCREAFRTISRDCSQGEGQLSQREAVLN